MVRINKIVQSKAFFIVVSCIASVLLWLYVVNYENTSQELTLSGLEVTYLGGDDILQDRNLLVTDRDMQNVSLTLLVKRRMVSLLNKDSVQVSVDLRDIHSTGVYEKVYTVTFPETVDEDEIVTLKKTPEFMTVNIDRLSKRSLEIRGDFAGSIAEGFMREPIVYEPETIAVSGPETLVSKLDHAQVVIDRENLSKTVRGTVNFTLVDADGATVQSEDLVTDVDSVIYTIPIVMVKDVMLNVELIEGGGAKEKDAVRDIEPKVVTLSGDAEILGGINQISLGTIDLGAFAQSYTETYPIPLPNGVNNLSGEKEATVTVSIKGLATKRVIATNIDFIHVTEGYTANAITQYKEVVVRGPLEIVDLIDSSCLRVVGDLSSIGNAVGRYSVPTTVYIDGYSEAGVVGNEYNVVVSLEVATGSPSGDALAAGGKP